MRFLIAAALAVVSIVLVPARSVAQTSLDAFGSVRMDHLASLADSGFPVDFGGRVSFDVLPAVQVFGEFGRLGNVMPPLVETGLAFTQLDLTASAFYGEGGVRLLAAPHSAVTPYVEGTAGVANLSFGARGNRLDDRCAHSRGVGSGRHARPDFRCRRWPAPAGRSDSTRLGLSLQVHPGKQRVELVPQHRRSKASVAPSQVWRGRAFLISLNRRSGRLGDQKYCRKNFEFPDL